MCVCVCACVRTCVRALVCVCVCVCVYLRLGDLGLDLYGIIVSVIRPEVTLRGCWVVVTGKS